MRTRTRHSEPPAGLVASVPGLVVQVLHSASEGPRIEDLVPIETYLSPLKWYAAIVRLVIERAADIDEARAVLAELDLRSGALAQVSESRRTGACSYARHRPAEVVDDMLAYHREWSARGHSHSIVKHYPEANQ